MVLFKKFAGVAMRWKKVFTCDPNATRTLLDDAYDIYQPMLLLVLMIFEWGVLLWKFQSKNVQYREVLELEDNNFLRTWDVLKWVIIMLICTIISLALFIVLRIFGKIGASVIFAAPTFRQAFLASIITSLAKVLADMVSAIALMIHIYGVKCADTYLGQRSVIALVITCVPFIYQFVQSLLAGFYEPNRMQYLNASKHLLTMTMMMISSVKYLLEDHTLWSASFGRWWIVLVVLNSVACFLWEFYQDWNLSMTMIFLQANPRIKSKIITKKWWYKVIVLVDLFLRATWTIRLSPSLLLSPGWFSNRWISLSMSVLEIISRPLWMV
ncbi:uncharacterized protein LOC113274821 isoform X2 [Papaver somniferum]|uniref:uncharacterized protein LOC113274821 isoform X2 n=1 Tax=Papaver somniferum TaxID=3469 RepID=UPI000E700CB1|nr:uncharacterized protein LOC113274821 isoform X2 [Papaver somniferum]